MRSDRQDLASVEIYANDSVWVGCNVDWVKRFEQLDEAGGNASDTAGPLLGQLQVRVSTTFRMNEVASKREGAEGAPAILGGGK